MLRFLFPPDLLRSRGFSATFSFLSSPPFTTSFRAGDGPPFFGDLKIIRFQGNNIHLYKMKLYYKKLTLT